MPAVPRGSRTLFSDIFVAIPDKQRKGRSLSLIEKRNECLIDRYYWHGRKILEGGKRIAYSSLLETISNEFYLSHITIYEIVDNNYEYLTQLKKEWQDEKEEKMRKHFQCKWLHLIW
jgi:hypothetical protein